MAVAVSGKKIDDVMEKASQALADCRYFEAERLAKKALGMARNKDDFDRMARIVLPLQEARRQRIQQALDVGTVTIIDEPITEDMEIEPGCYLFQPPQVGADARRLRLAAWESETPVAVICREPETNLGLCPIVAICPGTTIRTKIDPPEDPDNPDIEWFVYAMEELGDWAIASIDSELEPVKRVDTLIERLEADPDHEGLHQELINACRDAQHAGDESS